MSYTSKTKYKPLERSGIKLLYTFTPFKIIKSTKDKYVIQLIELSGFKTYPKKLLWKSVSSYVKFRVKMKAKAKEIRKSVITPIELYATTFTEPGNRYIFVRCFNSREKKTYDECLETIYAKAGEIFARYRPIFAEYSYKALDHPYTCRQGYVLISSSETCPLAKVCPRRRVELGTCKYYVSVKNTYAGLYYVYPLVKKEINVRSEKDLESIVILPYNGLPLVKIAFTSKAELRAYISAIILTPKMRWLIFYPRFYLFPRETIGIQLQNVHALILHFNKKLLVDVLKKILIRSEKVFRWITFKYLYGRYMPLKGRQTAKVIDGYKGFNEMEKTYSTILEHPNREHELKKQLMNTNLLQNMDFLNFATFVLIHTLAHALLTLISTTLNVPEEELGYYIDHPILEGLTLPEEEIRLIVFEDAIGGYGYLKTLAADIRENPETLEHMFRTMLNFLVEEDKKVKKNLSTINITLDNILNAIEKENVKEIIKTRIMRLLELRNTLNVIPHIIALRNVVLNGLELDEKTRSLIEELFSGLPLCWDGCLHCVMMEKGCMFPSFDQVFTVSKSMLQHFLEQILPSIHKLSYSLYFTSNVKEHVENLIENAKEEILISTASLSPITIEYLGKLLKEKPGLNIKILATSEFETYRHWQAVKKLGILAKTTGRIEARLLDKVHAKGILIDNLVLIKGSFNFTKRGFEINVENLDIEYNPQEIRRFREGYIKIWNIAKIVR